MKVVFVFEVEGLVDVSVWVDSDVVLFVEERDLVWEKVRVLCLLLE